MADVDTYEGKDIHIDIDEEERGERYGCEEIIKGVK